VKCSWVKYSWVKCSWVKCSWVKCSWVKHSWVKRSWVKCSESLSKRVSNIIRIHIDHMKFAAKRRFGLSNSFIFFWIHSLSFLCGCVFCVLLFDCVNCVLLLLCLFILIVIM
jgi:hypothetical protein